MVVNLRAKKRLVSRVTGVGIHRIRFDSDHLEDIADAITRENVRGLITANTITFKPIVGTSRGRAQQKKLQKKPYSKRVVKKLEAEKTQLSSEGVKVRDGFIVDMNDTVYRF